MVVLSQIEELRAFVLIVETGSLTQAADRIEPFCGQQTVA